MSSKLLTKQNYINNIHKVISNLSNEKSGQNITIKCILGGTPVHFRITKKQHNNYKWEVLRGEYVEGDQKLWLKLNPNEYSEKSLASIWLTICIALQNIEKQN